jgi:hypothetical protein
MGGHSSFSIPFVEKAWSNDREQLRAVAAAKLKAERLQWWWCKRYNRPMKDPLLQEYTIEELQIEYYMHLIEIDPQEAYPRRDMGAVQFRTGDKLIDKWEAKLAKGQEIDWDEGVDPTFLERFKTFSKKRAKQLAPALVKDEIKAEVQTSSEFADDKDREEFLNSLLSEGFHDDYTSGVNRG